MTLKQHNEIDRIVAELDETKLAEHFRSADRPNGRFVRASRRRDPAIVRAQGRIRTAHWRNRLDQRKAATTYQIAMSLVMSLVTADIRNLNRDELNLVGVAFADLQSRGFDLAEVRASLRRLRNQMVDTVDREGEETETTGPALARSEPATVI
jgi:hypothetical protein